ncbi:hypothetical protein HK104_006806 [Borealophlyctis nickersoniae]|nr:hypothetical protein HK104_006806 [Borealophlyctis nickersoniae]
MEDIVVLLARKYLDPTSASRLKGTSRKINNLITPCILLTAYLDTLLTLSNNSSLLQRWTRREHPDAHLLLTFSALVDIILAKKRLAAEDLVLRWLWDDLLRAAAEMGHASALERLLRRVKEDGRGSPDFLNQLLYVAAERGREELCGRGNVSIVKLLLERGARIHVGIFITAASVGNEDLVRLFIAHGAHVHDENNEASKAACAGGHVHVLLVLLEAGADIHAGVENALTRAAYYGHEWVVRELIGHGAVVGAGDNNALRLAAVSGSASIVQTLIDHGADPNAKHGEALRFAAKLGHTQVVKVLLDGGAWVTSGAVEAAAESGHTEIWNLLVTRREETGGEAV